MATARSIWEKFKARLDGTMRAITSTKSTHVTSTASRAAVRVLVSDYFSATRPALLRAGMAESECAGIDLSLQRALELASASNRRTSYLETLNDVRRLVVPLEISLLKLLGQGAGHATLLLSDIERRILDTLGKLLPSAAASYEQGLRDLVGPPRLSYRGTATELREAFREVLDHLAADEYVVKSPGFKLESGQTKPTQKQKVQYILKARHVSDSAIKTSVDALASSQERVGAFARSAYTRASLSTHTQTTLQEVRQLKQYIDAGLGELLEIHKS
jgi:hypothetical protein